MFQGDPPIPPNLKNARSIGGRRTVVRALAAVLAVVLLMILGGARPAAAQDFSFTPYTQMSGLRNLGIEQLLVDRNGDLWAATDGGLYRYDGTSFTLYDKSRGIPADATMAMGVSPTGRIIARVDAGLYSGDADHFEPMLTAEGPAIADEYTAIVAPSDDRVLYTNDHQIVEIQRTGGPGSLWKTRPLFNAAQLAEHSELASVQGIIEVNGKLWFGCGLRLCNLDG